MIIYHTHHIVPKHMGGTDDSTNLVRLTVEEHAQAHLELYEKYGDERDLVAHRMLLGQITKAEAIKIIQKLPKTERWKKTMSERNSGEGNPFAGKKHTEETKKKMSIANSGKNENKRLAQKKLHAEGKSNIKPLYNSDNPRSQKVYAKGVVYNTLKEATYALGYTNHNTIAYRCRSNKSKWSEYYYV
jgi:hypothetical protein